MAKALQPYVSFTIALIRTSFSRAKYFSLTQCKQIMARSQPVVRNLNIFIIWICMIFGKHKIITINRKCDSYMLYNLYI